jgi:deoxyribose-phosphate aldolase
MDLATYIDHTNLQPHATPADIAQLTAEAVEHRFASVCVHGCYVPQVASALGNSPIQTCSVVGFPLGAMKCSVKTIEATVACKDGATEIDFVAFLPALFACDIPAATAEFRDIVRAVRSVSPTIIVKVILETAALMANVDNLEAEKRLAAACQAAQSSGCDFVKTSTGFHPAGGATALAVQLLRKHAGPLKVKASGGIRSYDDAMRMIEAGADRLGCSAGVAILQGRAAAHRDY